MNIFLREIYNFISENRMLSEGDKVIVGLSGGADSVCLLRTLHALKERLGMADDSIMAVHINHMLRGEEADRDEAFAKKLCDDLGIEFFSFRKDIGQYATDLGLSQEEAGRKYRYQCFEQVAMEHNNAKIAVAHNKNDFAETVIFNMLRGSGLNGMSGISCVRDNIIRPLLGVTRKQIEEYLSDINQDYCDDSTNATLNYDRNKIRHVILPAMTDINSKAVDHICHMADEAKESYQFIHGKAMEKLDGDVYDDDFGRTVTLDINQLYKCNTVLQEHMIQEAIGNVAGQKKDITRKHIISVVGLIYQETGSMIELPYGIKARRSYEKLIVTNKKEMDLQYMLDVSEEGIYNIPNWGDIEVKFLEYNSSMEVAKKNYTKMFDYGKINGKLCIRTAEDGDYITIDSKGSRKKLSRVFIDNKIDREKRKTWPVLALGQEIIWVLGLRYNEAYKLGENTKKVMYISCIGRGE